MSIAPREMKGAAGPRPLGKGHVLRVKSGYNPNSSSIGSIVFALSAKILPATAAFGAVAGLIYSAFLRPRTANRQPAEPSDSLSSHRRKPEDVSTP